MKRLLFLFAFSFWPMVSLSVYAQAWGYNGIKILNERSVISDFPVLILNNPPDRQFRSFVSGETVSDLFTGDSSIIFDNRLIIKIDENFTLFNEFTENSYYLMIFDFFSIIPDGSKIELGDLIGHTGSSSAKIIVFSETLDPYLVVTSESKPVFYNGYFWFHPGFFSPTGGTNWLSFDPVESITAVLAEAAEYSSSNPGFTWLNQRVRFKYAISHYPKNITENERNEISIYENMLYGRSGIIGYITEINTGSLNYVLCWQNGFLNYLRREYTLNNDIWLYGVLVRYDPWLNKGYIFLRDFTYISIEEMYEERLRLLRDDS